MKYSRFGVMAFVLGSMAIIGSLFVSSTSQLIPAEATAQLLLILVLAGALLWGRNGGFVTALIATAIYVGMRYPVLAAEGLSADAVTMIVARVLGYAVIGVIGGELAGRMKYILTRREHDVMVDHATHVYSALYAGRAIAAAIGKHHRYGTTCSVVTLTLSPAIWSGLSSPRMNALMRRVASYLRNDVRMVDDVAYRDNGGFILILPETEGAGAEVAAKRLCTGIASLLGCDVTELNTRVMSCGTDDAALADLARTLAPEPLAGDDVAPATPQVSGRRASDRSGETV